MDYVKAASELRQMLVAVEIAASQVVALGMYLANANITFFSVSST